MENLCPKTAKCAIFNNHLLKRESSIETYKNLFCRTNEKYKECKRYMTSERYGKCADFIMPNTSDSIEKIGERMREKGIID